MVNSTIIIFISLIMICISFLLGFNTGSEQQIKIQNMSGLSSCPQDIICFKKVEGTLFNEK